uniref:Isoaspartyl peptidase/L-asparaginase n=1 Tax=Takifugu rubripes TaxID=31033 RepID=A0A674P3D9_TAKRU
MPAVVVVHGGAWSVPDKLAKAVVDGVKMAALDGFSVLERGGSALDAVEAAVRNLEDNVTFNAGHGAVLNADGDVELDAIIMDGRALGSGAVSSVKNIPNPVSLARAVMEKTPHLLLTSRGANLFAESIGMATVPTDTLVTANEREEWEEHRSYVAGVTEDFNSKCAHDTVGAVAVDSAGNVACATSTGGIRNKMVGRVGDAAIIGCGGYADNSSGAVSCTGHGESILKVTLARLILSHMEQGSGDTLHGCILFLTNKQFHLHAFFFPVPSQGNPQRSLHSWLCSTWASVCAAQEESSWCLHQDSGQLNLLQ